MINFIIELLFTDDINLINKFEIYKLIKKCFQTDKKKFTYYKANILYNKLLDTKILTPTYEKNLFKFNKQIEKKPIIINFD